MHKFKLYNKNHSPQPLASAEVALKISSAQSYFGKNHPLLLPFEKRSKIPKLSVVKGYSNFADIKINEPAYRAAFNDGNIGIRNGCPKARIITIDANTPEAAVMLRKKNLWLADTLTVNSPHGFHFHMRWHTKSEMPFVERLFNESGHEIGELRGQCALTLIPPSIHPDGGEYSFTNVTEPLEIGWGDIVLPDGWAFEPAYCSKALEV